MPKTAHKQLVTPTGLPFADVPVDADDLTPVGIKRGSTVDYIPFNKRFMQFFYHIKIKSTGKELVVDKAFIVTKRVKHKNNVYDLTDIDILGVFVEKPRLRLMRERS